MIMTAMTTTMMTILAMMAKVIMVVIKCMYNRHSNNIKCVMLVDTKKEDTNY
jgi:hypothetical protein